MNQTKLLSLLAILLLTFGAYAGDGSSGCGAGWYILKKNSLVSSSLRATTNAIFLNSTFGMTFGTSNCSKHSIVKNNKRAIHFTENSFAQLQMEIATGHGEYALAFADLMGCSNSPHIFLHTVRNNFQRILPTDDTTPVTMIENVRTLVDNDQYLSKKCSLM